MLCRWQHWWGLTCFLSQMRSSKSMVNWRFFLSFFFFLYKYRSSAWHFAYIINWSCFIVEWLKVYFNAIASVGRRFLIIYNFTFSGRHFFQTAYDNFYFWDWKQALTRSVIGPLIWLDILWKIFWLNSLNSSIFCMITGIVIVLCTPAEFFYT